MDCLEGQCDRQRDRESASHAIRHATMCKQNNYDITAIVALF
jgi:hypothetical protein